MLRSNRRRYGPQLINKINLQLLCRIIFVKPLDCHRSLIMDRRFYNSVEYLKIVSLRNRNCKWYSFGIAMQLPNTPLRETIKCRQPLRLVRTDIIYLQFHYVLPTVYKFSKRWGRGECEKKSVNIIVLWFLIAEP